MMLLVNSLRTDYFPIRFQLSHSHSGLSSESLTVDYYLQKRTTLRFQLIDITGNILNEFVSEKQDAGMHSTDFNVANLIAGRYYFRIFAGKYCETKEMLFRN